MNAGLVSKDYNKSHESHYFIKLEDNNKLEEIIKKINELDFCEKNNTVGPKSISKQELIEKLNKIMNNDKD